MNTYIVRDKEAIIRLTGNPRYNRILLHLDNEHKIVKYESDYTLFELTERLDYDYTVMVIRELNMF